MATPEQPCAFSSIFKAFLAREFGWEHHAPYLSGTERIDSDCRGKSAIDPAGEPKNDPGESIANNIIAKCDHHRPIDIRGKGIELVLEVRLAAPAKGAPHPVGDEKRLFPVRHLYDHFPVRVHDKRGAVKSELILTANPVKEYERQSRACGPGPREMLSDKVLVELVRASVRNKEQLGAKFSQM